MVGLLVSDIRLPYAGNATRGVEDKLSEAGFTPILASTDGDNERTIDLLKKFRELGACGFILTPAQYGIPQAIAEELYALRDAGIPTVVAGHDLTTKKINFVSMRGQEASKALVSHLVQLGHRDIAYIGDYFSRGLAIHRWLGYQEALLANGITIRPDLINECQSVPSDAFEATKRLMSLPSPPTAIYATNDVHARGVIDFVTHHQISVPDEMSVVTYDYKVLAQRPIQTLTSIVVSAYDLGVTAAELFLDMLQNPDKPHSPCYVDFELEIRDSTAPPRKLPMWKR